MKKILLTLLSFCVLSTSAQTEIIVGDLNGDGELTIADVTSLAETLLGKTPTRRVVIDGTYRIEEIVEHEYVDLGLPSGTLWATMNVGAETPEDYGDYFAWGEIASKSTYYWSYYIHTTNGEYGLTKYCTNEIRGNVDNKTELDPEDDAAYMNWGKGWRMPSKTQQDELYESCTWTWDSKRGGFLVTGPNGNSIFLPAAGCYYGKNNNSAITFGYYWSRSLSSNKDYTYNAYYLYFDSINYRYQSGARYYGYSVRAVRQN